MGFEDGLERIVRRSSTALLILDSEESIIIANSAAKRLLGRDFNKLDIDKRQELEIEAKDSKSRLVKVDKISIRWHGEDAFLVLLFDITKRKKLKRKLEIKNKLLKIIQRVNEAISKQDDENSLFKKMCKALIKIGGYKLAWVGLKKHDDKKTVKPLTQCGYERGYLDSIRVSWGDNEYGQGPTGRAIRTGKPQVNRDVLANPKYKPWREEAKKRGYNSSIALPLKIEKEVIGALNIYSAERDSFNDLEVQLLSELAVDFSRGISLIRVRRKLVKSERRFRELFQNSSNLIQSVNLEGEIIDVNQAWLDKLGYARKNALKLELKDIIAEKKLDECLKLFKKCVLGGRVDGIKTVLKTRKRDELIVEGSSYPVKKDGEVLSVWVVFRDVTERERARHKFQERLKELDLIYQTTLTVRRNKKLDKIFREIVNKLPEAYQRPEAACARIEYEDKVYESRDFWASRWHQEADIVVNGEKRGVVRVYYKEKKEFLKEEQKMLGEVASQLSSFLSHRQVMNELKKSEKRYQAIIENTGTAVVIIEEDTTISYVNKFFEKLSGYSKEEVEGKKSWTEFVTEEYLDEMKEYHYKRRKEKAPKSYEFDFIDKDDEVHRMLLFIDVIPGTEKSVASLIDITELKEAEEKLRVRKRELEAIFNNTSDSIIVLDMKGRIIRANDQVVEDSDYTRKELIGTPFTKLKKIIPKEELPKLRRVFEKFLMGRDPGLVETQLKTKEGELVVEMKLSSLIQDDKRVGVIVVLRDITARREQEKLKERVKAQKELEQLRENFLIMITHELKQPLTPIMGYAGLLKNKTTDSEKLDYLKRIIKNSYEMRDMINRILTLLKLEAGILKFEFKEHDLSSIIEDTLVNKKSLIVLKKIKVKKYLKSVYVKCDRKRIKDVFLNLIDNAVKFSGKGGVIELKTWVDDGKACASVKDYGVGIKKENIKDLFKKFYQTDEGKQRGGTGIGLTMIKQIIKKHEGNINVKSEYGEWTEFIVELPRMDG